jgi:hypothetical protein
MNHSLSRIRSVLWVTFLLIAHSAVAAATFVLDLRGQATHWKDGWECIVCTDPNDPRLQPVTFDWVGLVTVTLTGEEDGVYSGGLAIYGGDFLSLSVDTNIDHFDAPYGASAVVSGGQIVAIDAYFENPPTRLILTGMTAIYDQPHLHHYGPTHATAIITNVPETSTWALMAVGLCAVGFWTRRLRSIDVCRNPDAESR